MADKTPIRGAYNGSSLTGLAEYATGDTVGIAFGGTGLATVGSNQLLTGNGTSALTSESNLTYDGTTLATTAFTATGNVSLDGGTFVFNESGADKDFRVEGDSEANLLMIDASTDRIGIGTATPSHLLDVEGVAHIATCIITPKVCISSQYALPAADGSAGEILCTDGSGAIAFAEAASSGHTIANEGSVLASRTCLNFTGAAVTASDNSGTNATDVLVCATNALLGIRAADGTACTITLSNAAVGTCLQSDTAPKLGGNLDVNSNSIVSASNGNIPITPNGSGVVILDGICHPTADGSAGQVLCTNGSAALQWGTIADTTPGGSDTYVQFNNGGAFGGAAGLTWDDTTFKASNICTAGTATLATVAATTITGTIGTAAQTSITSVGTLSSLTLGGTLSVGDNDITNVGDIAVDTISGDADSNTTIGFPGSDALTFNTGGSERMRLIGGYLGIGTTAPDEILHINSSNVWPRLLIESTASNGYPTLTFENDATLWNVYADGANSDSPDAFTIYNTTGNAKFLIQTGGKVGIGTDDPGDARLAIVEIGETFSTTIPAHTVMIAGEGYDAHGVASSAQLFLADTSTAGAATGGGIQFGGRVTTTDLTEWAGIFGQRESGTSGCYKGYLSFQTRCQGAAMREAVRICSNGVTKFTCDVCVADDLFVYDNLCVGDQLCTANDLYVGDNAIIYGTLCASERIYVPSSACVGIGTTIPDMQFHIYDGSAGSVTINTDAALGIESSSNSYINFITASGCEAGLMFGRATDNNHGGIFYTGGCCMNLVNGNGYNRISIEPDGDILFSCKLFFDEGQVSLDRYSDAGDGYGVSINYNGYNGGTDYYRDFMVYDGKNSMVMVVDGSSGKVGIGTTAPAAALHTYNIDKGVTVEGNDNATITIKSTSADRNAYLYFVNSADSKCFDIVNNSYDPQSGTNQLRFSSTDTSCIMVFNQNGAVGIGTAAPVGGGPGSLSLYKDSSNYVRFWDNAVATGLLRSTGANSPTMVWNNSNDDRLEVTVFQRTNAGSAWGGWWRHGLMGINASPQCAFTIGTGNSKPLSFFTNNAITAEFQSDGDFCIYRCLFNSAAYNIYVGGRWMGVSSGGQLGYMSSTCRHKMNIVDSDDNAEWILQARPRKFNMRKKDDEGTILEEAEGGTKYGFIAEELREIAPDEYFRDYINDDDTVDGIDFLGLTAPIIKMIQKMHTRIETLETQVAALS